jgi:tRNA(Ile)-lysidine synthase
MYHNAVQTLQQHVLGFIRDKELMRAGDRVGVAVSGGADSVALLRLLLELRSELGIVVATVHLNHRIRGVAADDDAQFVADRAAEHGLELHSEVVDAPAYAREHHLSLEAAGRELRYRFFARLISEGKVARVATAHTLDDQAETVLLRLIRGTGTRGLAGIYPQRSPDASGRRDGIVRPLLFARRSDLRDYLRDNRQPWREDGTNRDLTFLRNRVRHELLPLLQRHYNSGIVGVLGDTAETARAEEQYWESEVARAGALAAADHLDIAQLRSLPLALQRRLIRRMAAAQGCHLDFNRTELLLAFALGPTQSRPASRSLQLPDNLRVRRTSSHLVFDTSSAEKESASQRAGSLRYEYGFTVPGEVEVRELGKRMRASLVPAGLPTVDRRSGYNPQQFLDPRTLGPQLLVRNWRPGDRFWPAHTKAPRKVKDLLQERRIALPDRAVWPVVVSGEEIVWVRGLAVAKSHLARSKAGGQALLIEELPLVR